MRLVQHLPTRVQRRTRDLASIVEGRYRSYTTSIGLSFERLGIPPIKLDTHSRSIIFTCDFLPDRYSLSGTQFRKSPHYDFVCRYLRDPHFDYRETRYYRLLVSGHLPSPYHGIEQAELRCRQFISIIETIRSDGLQSEHFSPITFVECSDGSLMILNGKHRLATYLALGIVELSAIVCFGNEVSALFQDVKERSWPRGFYHRSLQSLEKIGKPKPRQKAAISSLIDRIKESKLETWADVYHPIPFFEFRNLSTQVDNRSPYQRLAMILSVYQDLQGMRILDLGCNVGFYSFSLAKRGANVTGIDSRSQYVDFAAFLARIYEVPATFIKTQIAPEFVRQAKERFDVTLCFSVLQWVISQRGMDFARQVLRSVSLKSRAMFFDVPVNSGKARLTCEPGNERSFVKDFLSGNTSYDYIKHLGDIHPYVADTRHVFFCANTAPSEAD